MKKLYVGCSLTLAPEEFRKTVAKLKDTLRADYEVLDFLGLITGTPKDVYEWDIHHCVRDCDLFLAVCDYPSLGLGYEMGVAVEKLRKPTLAVAHAHSKVGRIFTGIDQPHYRFLRYTSFSEIPNMVKSFTEELGV